MKGEELKLARTEGNINHLPPRPVWLMAAGNRLMSRFDRSSCSFVYKQALQSASVLRLQSAGSFNSTKMCNYND